MIRFILRNCRWLLAGLLALGAGLAPAAGAVLVTGDWERVAGDGVILQPNGSAGKGQLDFDLREAPLDLSGNIWMSVDLANGTAAQLDVRVTVANADLQSDKKEQCRFFVKAGETEALQVFLMRPSLPEDNPLRKALGEIRGLPGGHQGNWSYLDAAAVGMVQVTVQWKGNDPGTGTITLSLPHGAGEYRTDKILPDDLPHPLLDRMGQLRGETWEGKVTDAAELALDGQRDLARYANHPVRDGFTEYGGWKDGPRFAATGHFQTRKVDGKWWFIDPEGFLFWSLGVTGAGGGAATQIKGREPFFPELKAEPLWGPDARKNGYNFLLANQYRKYGGDWENISAAVTLGRMRAWGMNTIGAWSVPKVLSQEKVPYTLILNTKPQKLGRIDKVPDPFSPTFLANLRAAAAAAAARHAGDPWNLGIFIDNELRWGNGSQLAREVVGLPENVPAKRAMLAQLRGKYADIAALNSAWGCAFASFGDIRGLDWSSATKACHADMAAFVDHLADTYYATCAAVLREYFPGHLYLGSRFHGAVYGGKNIIVQKAASRHVDVMSYNIYKTSVADAVLHQEVDRPVIIGEFHFGTGSHGVWGYGLVPCNSLKHQAELYRAYVNEALEDPRIVGAHWFQWADQPATGRSDGENYRIGIVSITDRPYATLTQAIEAVSAHMYERRQAAR